EQAEEAQDDDDQDQKDQADDDIIGTLVTMSQKEKPEVPRSSSSRSLLSNYGNQFLNLSSDASLVGTIKETTDAEINSLLDVQIQQEITYVLSALLLDVLVSVIPPLTTTTTTPLNTPLPTPPIISTATTTTPTVPDLLSEVVQRVYALEKEVKELKQVDHSTTVLASVRSQVPLLVDEYLGLTLGDTLQKVLQKHTKELIQQFPQKSAFEIDSLKKNSF
ncbi:hypothetical protein Tco_1534627, partial [Tanacetum coccineum]